MAATDTYPQQQHRRRPLLPLYEPEANAPAGAPNQQQPQQQAPAAPRGDFSTSKRDNPDGPGVFQPQMESTAAGEATYLQGLPPSSDPQVNALRGKMITTRQNTIQRVRHLFPEPAVAGAQPVATATGASQPIQGQPAPTTGGTSVPGTPATPGFAYSKTQHDLLKQQYARQHQAWVDANKAETYADEGTRKEIQKARETAAQKLTDYENKFINPPTNPVTGSGGAATPATQPAATTQPATQPSGTPSNTLAITPTAPAVAQAKTYGPEEGIPEENRSFESRNPDGSLKVDRSDPTYQQHIRDMYQSAGEGAARQNQEIAATPLPLPGDAQHLNDLTAAQQAGSGGATQRNAIAKAQQMTGDAKGFANSVAGENQLQAARATAGAEAGAIKQRAKNAGPEARAQRAEQTAANTTSANAADARLAQFANGNYDLSTPLTQDQLAAPPQTNQAIDRFASSQASGARPQAATVYQRTAAGYATRGAAPAVAQPTSPVMQGLDNQVAQSRARTVAATPPAPGAPSAPATTPPTVPTANQPAPAAPAPTAATTPAVPPAQPATIPPEAQQAAARAGGTVAADGTMTIGNVRYTYTTVNGQPGWKKAG